MYISTISRIYGNRPLFYQIFEGKSSTLLPLPTLIKESEQCVISIIDIGKTMTALLIQFFL